MGDKTEGGQELRGMIRTFIEQEKLDIRVTRTTTNAALLEMIEKEMQDRGKNRNLPHLRQMPASLKLR